MNTQAMTSSTIKINLSSGILRNARVEAERIGISLQDFIRMLMATYFSNIPAFKSISHEQKLYDQAIREIEKGEYTTVKTQKDLHKYLDGLNA